VLIVLKLIVKLFINILRLIGSDIKLFINVIRL